MSRGRRNSRREKRRGIASKSRVVAGKYGKADWRGNKIRRNNNAIGSIDRATWDRRRRKRQKGLFFFESPDFRSSDYILTANVERNNRYHACTPT